MQMNLGHMWGWAAPGPAAAVGCRVWYPLVLDMRILSGGHLQVVRHKVYKMGHHEPAHLPITPRAEPGGVGLKDRDSQEEGGS